ncbi:hypothetical protein PMZ80_000286 [Knufia obscura]|uniref:Uncharacterized protein n=2 Tax=Knufia TaxID=430999 RepID=A0AAN8EQV9_9EURO|nr:hypothetical protein PMZ80_000286 [Knufia obscura]KAK5956783.1 hypothetical protein OHC33_002271 [Knufia fluminis]
MLGRLAKRRQEYELHPHDWDFRDPTPRRSQARFHSRSSDDFPTVPAPLIFRDVAIPYSLAHSSTAPPTFRQYPAPGHVASHLLLIECFYTFKADIEQNATLEDAFNALHGTQLRQNSGTWPQYLLVAIKRFKLWITKIEAIIRHSAVFNRFGTGSHLHGAFNENYLPPLDVLFIWYCYLQSPASYERLIASNDFRLLGTICFPWHVFPTAIDQATLDYKPSPAAKTLWEKLVGVPFDLEACLGVELESGTTAFTTHEADILELAVVQTELLERCHRHRWLRSPALHGTIARAMQRYSDAVLSTQPQTPWRTQQIPMVGDSETRSTHSLQLDLVAQLVLNTHRAYHGAWTAFARTYNIRDEDRPPPPSYEESHGKSVDKGDDLQISVSHDKCYCWICERIKDELEEKVVSPRMTALRQTPSQDDTDLKQSETFSDSSSDTDEPAPHLGLSRKQIKRIKAEIRIYRNAEVLREEKIQQQRDSG